MNRFFPFIQEEDSRIRPSGRANTNRIRGVSMNTYQAKNIINVAMAGHSGAGKTSLAEAMLYLAGASDRRGKVGEGNTVCD